MATKIVVDKKRFDELFETAIHRMSFESNKIKAESLTPESVDRRIVYYMNLLKRDLEDS